MASPLLQNPIASPPPRFDRELLARAPAGLRTFFRIAEAWGLTSDEQQRLLGQPPRSTFYRWRSGHAGGVTLDTMERLSHVFGIYEALHRIFLEPAHADGWLRRPNAAPPFDGRPAVEWLLTGRVADLYEVRRYLEAVAEGGL
jgi:hypothetical protein